MLTQFERPPLELLCNLSQTKSFLPSLDFVPVSKDPRYAKYFKMVTVGIPPAALHVKMQMEGLDPVYLDNPDQPAPPMTESNPQSTDSDASSSD